LSVFLIFRWTQCIVYFEGHILFNSGPTKGETEGFA
jgi:hypothetical protein